MLKSLRVLATTIALGVGYGLDADGKEGRALRIALDGYDEKARFRAAGKNPCLLLRALYQVWRDAQMRVFRNLTNPGWSLPLLKALQNEIKVFDLQTNPLGNQWHIITSEIINGNLILPTGWVMPSFLYDANQLAHCYVGVQKTEENGAVSVSDMSDFLLQGGLLQERSL